MKTYQNCEKDAKRRFQQPLIHAKPSLSASPGRRHNVNDPEIQEVNKLINLSFEEFQDTVIWFDFMPWLIPIVPHFVKKWIGIAHLPGYIEVISKRMKVSKCFFSFVCFITVFRSYLYLFRGEN